MDISLTKLPWYAQLGAFFALGVAGCGVFYYYYEMPVHVDIESRRGQITSLRADINKGLSTARKLPEFQAQVADLQTRLESLRAVLPDEKDAADLLNRMQNVAAQSSLTIKTFKPGAIVTKQLHAEWPIELELEGTYHNLAIFFDRVGKFTRIVNVTGVDIKGKDKSDANTTITAHCVATTFVLLDKPTPPKPGAPGAAAPKPAGRGA
ncbi:MAG TPA: type 4a pilus biogenesis protein PilO [Vicinamibacterales bacterium]|nr:type 4a pilus biogenesis protein PilO [Vicinamibacterales bacterium]